MKTSLKVLAVSALVFLAACASTPKNPFVGAWTINMDTPIGELPGELNFAADGTGFMLIQAPGSEGQPPQSFAGATFQDNTVSFSTSIDAQGQPISLNFTGSVDGDNLTGAFDTDIAGSLAVTGTRNK